MPCKRRRTHLYRMPLRMPTATATSWCLLGQKSRPPQRGVRERETLPAPRHGKASSSKDPVPPDPPKPIDYAPPYGFEPSPATPPSPVVPPCPGAPAPPADDVIIAMPEDEVEEPVEPPPPIVPRAPRREDVGWTDGLLGYKVRYDPAYVTPKGVAFKANWKIRCGNPDHPTRCQKTRNVAVNHCQDCGAIEPAAYLHVWTGTPPLPGKNHTNTDPSQEDVVAFAAAHKDDLEALVRRVAGP